MTATTSAAKTAAAERKAQRALIDAAIEEQRHGALYHLHP
jgi:hypothetical protein